MATVTAAMVKALRERTGAAMMACKKALSEAAGDLDQAVGILRKKGAAQAEKKSGRIAAEGVIGYCRAADGKRAALVEINSETDFVAKQEDVIGFARDLAQHVMETDPADVDALLASPMDGEPVESRRTALVARLGEKIAVRRFVRFVADRDYSLDSYLHGTRIGVLVESRGGGEGLGRDIAMQVAASAPMCLDESQIGADVLAREKDIFVAQAQNSGKPDNIIEKMVAGRLRKFVQEATLLGQPFVKDPETAVADLLNREQAVVARFVRFEVGEGLEKRTENFAEEVLAQAKGS